MLEKFRFNSIVVRLKGVQHKEAKSRNRGFNSIVVRLKGSNQSRAIARISVSIP